SRPIPVAAATALRASCASLSGLLDGRPDQVAPLRPRAVVILDVRDSNQMLQHEPRMARAFADAAIGDHWRARRDSCATIQRFQLVDALECAVIVARLRPRNALRSRDMTAA